MIATSLKDLKEIRLGNMLSLPEKVLFDAWSNAWGKSCIGVDCSGLKIYFLNSIKIVVPAVLISTVLGRSEWLRAHQVEV